MGIEFELKYAATEQRQAAIAGEMGPLEEISMETTYFDTADRALSRHHMTLRRRLENGVSICTFKGPAQEAGRAEWEVACDDILGGIPLLCDAGAPELLKYLTAFGVAPFCGARFTRRIAMIRGRDFTAELALDAGVLLGGGKTQPLCEVELELKGGSRQALQEYAGKFAEKFGLEREHRSKFSRARALAEE